jgi:hypothetical protein
VVTSGTDPLVADQTDTDLYNGRSAQTPIRSDEDLLADEDRTTGGRI